MGKLMQMAKKQGPITSAKQASTGPKVTHDAGGGTTIYLGSTPRGGGKSSSGGGPSSNKPKSGANYNPSWEAYKKKYGKYPNQ